MSSIIDNIVLLIIRSVWPVSNVTSVHDVENTDRKAVLNADTAGMHNDIHRCDEATGANANEANAKTPECIMYTCLECP